MEIVGYRNVELVHQLTREGRFNAKYGKGTTLDVFQAYLLERLALATADWPLDKTAKEKHLLPRTYQYGYLTLAREFGMTLPDSLESIKVIDDEPRDLKKERNATNRIYDNMKKLMNGGYVKCLRKGNPQTRMKGVYLLTIGSPEENTAVEAYVRANLYMGSQVTSH